MSPPTNHRFSTLLREAGAMATQVRYLSRDLRPSHRTGSGPTCVLVHGLYATAGVFSPLRSRLETRHDASTHSFSYPPGPGIVVLAERLAHLVAEIESPRPIHLIGHSLGGLVVRYYVQVFGPDDRVVQTVSLAAPFAGTRRSFLVPGPAGRDIRVGAEILQLLRLGRPSRAELPHLSIVAGEDALIEPNAFPAYGERMTIAGVGHNGVLFDERAIRSVVERIQMC